MIEIEKGVPLPGGHGRRGGGYPWGEMEIGDSFLAPPSGRPSRTHIRSMGSVAWHAGRRLGRKFSCRTVDGGVRVWRVS